MKLLKKYKIAILAVGVLVAFFYWLLSDSAVIPLAADDSRPNAIIRGNTLMEEKDGKKNWVLYVEEIEIDSETNENILRGVKGTLYRENGTSIEVVAQTGCFNTESKKIILTGNVVATYLEGWVLKCDEVRWEPDKSTIFAKGKVHFVKGDLQVFGDEVETDRELDKVKITGNGIVKRGG